MAGPNTKARAQIKALARTLAGAAYLAAIDDVLAVADTAEREGLTGDELHTAVTKKLAGSWTDPGASHLALVFDAAAERGFAAGRVAALTAQKVARPYWLFSAIGDDRTSEICDECDGTVLAANHPWWATHTPDLHLRCRSSIVSLTRAQALALGITAHPPAVEPDDGFGRPEDLLEWEPRPGQYEAGPLDGVNMKTPTHRFDTAVGDVHVDGPAKIKPPKKAPVHMGELDAAKRNALPSSSFALPAKRELPIFDAGHTRDAASRLEQMKKAGSVTSAEYQKARAAIARAARKFGIDSAYNPKADDKAPMGIGRRRRGLHMRIGTSPGGGHTIEVLHAATELDGGTTVRGDGVELAAIPEDAAPAEGVALADGAEPVKLVWNQVTKIGAWRGHPAGPFEITPAINSEIVRNFKATTNRMLPLDFEHATEEAASEGSIPVTGAPAQGWIHDLDDRGMDGLWGLFEYLEPARGYVKAKKYKFFSPAIRFGARDKVTGKPIGARLTSGALTNSPFLDGLVPLAAKDGTTAAAPAAIALGDRPMLTRPMMSSAAFMPKVRAALKMPSEMATAAECKDQLGRLREFCAMADDGNAAPQGVPVQDHLDALHGLMGLGANTTVEQLLDAVEEMIDAAIAEHEAAYHTGEIANTDDTDAATTAAAFKDQEKIDMDATALLAEEKAKTTTLTQTNAELTVQLRDGAAKLADAEGKGAELRLALKDAQAETAKVTGERDVALTAAETAKSELVKLTDAKLGDRVESAFATYKDQKKLTDDDKADMLLSLKNDPARFERRFPAVPAAQQHLLRSVAGGRAGVPAVDAPTTFTGPKGSASTMLALADKYRKDGMTHEDALKRALKETSIPG